MPKKKIKPKNKQEKPDYISLQEATKYCSYSQEYLSLRARQGKLKAVKIGRNWLTKREWVEDYTNTNRAKNLKIKSRKVSDIRNKSKHIITFDFFSKKIGPRFLSRFQKAKKISLPVGIEKYNFRIPLFVRQALIISIVFLFIGQGIAFGKESFQNVFRDASFLVKNTFQSIQETKEDFGFGLAYLNQDIRQGLEDLNQGNKKMIIALEARLDNSAKKLNQLAAEPRRQIKKISHIARSVKKQK